VCGTKKIEVGGPSGYGGGFLGTCLPQLVSVFCN
jgi:hypothetical protein